MPKEISGSKVEWNEGDVSCPKCKGVGRVDEINRNKQSFSKICPNCGGLGKLDWVENICGKRNNPKVIKPGVYIQVSYMIPPESISPDVLIMDYEDQLISRNDI